jgi:hypothetical protein
VLLCWFRFLLISHWLRDERELILESRGFHGETEFYGILWTFLAALMFHRFCAVASVSIGPLLLCFCGGSFVG